MPDIFDQVAPDKAPAPAGDIFDQVAPDKAPAPAVPKAPAAPQQPGLLSRVWDQSVVSNAKDIGSMVEGASAAANHLAGNVFDLFDTGADQISNLTGLSKGGAFAAMRDWARQGEKDQQQKSKDLAGDRTGLPSAIFRGVGQGMLELPQYAIAGEVAGPIIGLGAVSALNAEDKGVIPALQAAAEGAALGGALHVMGPASRVIRLTGAAAMTYAQQRLAGADQQSSITSAVTMGLMAAQHPGGVDAKGIRLLNARAKEAPEQQYTSTGQPTGGGDIFDQVAPDQATADGWPADNPARDDYAGREQLLAGAGSPPKRQRKPRVPVAPPLKPSDLLPTPQEADEQTTANAQEFVNTVLPSSSPDETPAAPPPVQAALPVQTEETPNAVTVEQNPATDGQKEASQETEQPAVERPAGEPAGGTTAAAPADTDAKEGLTPPEKPEPAPPEPQTAETAIAAPAAAAPPTSTSLLPLEDWGSRGDGHGSNTTYTRIPIEGGQRQYSIYRQRHGFGASWANVADDIVSKPQGYGSIGKFPTREAAYKAIQEFHAKEYPETAAPERMPEGTGTIDVTPVKAEPKQLEAPAKEPAVIAPPAGDIFDQVAPEPAEIEAPEPKGKIEAGKTDATEPATDEPGGRGRVRRPGEHDPEVLGDGAPELHEGPESGRPIPPASSGSSGPAQPDSTGSVRGGSVSVPGGRTGEGGLDDSGHQTGPGDLTRQEDGDYRITDADHVGEGGEKVRLRNNLEAIRTLKKVLAEARPPTPAEQSKLAKFVGWGSLSNIFDTRKRDWDGAREELRALLTDDEYRTASASTVNAHYTSPMVVVGGLWNALRRFGFAAGNSWMEPAAGVGNVLGLQPDDMMPSRRTGIEMDYITGQIAKMLYPGSNIQISPFQKIALPNNFFDAAVSNVPFGKLPVRDLRYRKTPVALRAIHNYYFIKSLDLVRPGGIVAFITSRFTMDSQDAAIRKLIGSKANLLGMIRLPDTAFKGNAGTAVVTDIVYLQKRAEGEEPSGPSFENTREVSFGNDGNAHMNEYYIEHPEMVLGEHSMTGSHYGPDKNLTVKGTVTPEALAERVARLPENVFKPWTADTPAAETAGYLQLGDEVKDGGYSIVDGVIVQREGNIYRPAIMKNGLQALRIKAMLPVRKALYEVFSTQLDGDSEPKMVAARRALNKAYDSFVKAHGFLNALANRSALGEDPDYLPMAGALENWDRDAKTATKTDIFTKRTLEQPTYPDKAGTAAEALALTLNRFGRIDWAHMQELTGKTPDELRKELKGQVFRNPEGGKWQTQDEYLSGNVKDKLDVALEAANADPAFNENVEALQKIQPVDIPIADIKVSMGANWIPAHVVQKFLRHVLDQHSGTVTYEPNTALWVVTTDKHERGRAANDTTYGTQTHFGHKLLDLALNGKAPKVYMAGPTEGSRVVNPRATAIAQAAQDALRVRFEQWLWEDPKQSDALAKHYNRTVNNTVNADHDGSHLTLPGSNPQVTLRPHQKNAIWRILKTGNTLLAHEVGAGKTWVMVGAAMESRRLGLAKKPAIVVPNHMAAQFTREFMQLYPSARILTIGKEDFAAVNRKRAVARIAGSNWDAIIIRHSSFEKIPVSDETYQRFFDSQVAELRAALESASEGMSEKDKKKDKTVKEIEAAIVRLEVKLAKHLDREGKDNAVNFEHLGIDMMLVDEAHAFKALPIITRRQRIAGIPNRESNRATDMLMKTQYVSQLNGGQRGVVFATGTPVTNTMAELYNMQRYLQPETMRENGVAHFDAWANTFGAVRSGVELDVSGRGYRENTRFARLINIPELMHMYMQIADVKTAEMLKLPRPDVEGGRTTAIESPESPELHAFVDSLIERTDVVRNGGVDKSIDNMLKIVGEGKKAALDIRLVMPGAPDHPYSKVNQAVENVFRIWQKGKKDRTTQIVFCDLSTPKPEGKVKPTADQPEEEDPNAVAEGAGERAGFSVYNDMRKKWIAMGVPAKEIAFIHDYNSDQQKENLFSAVRSGSVRILMGSTEKMGVGTNVQKKMIALHHMDAPWRPADIMQRDGRIERQGNENKVIQKYQYVSGASFDAYSWQLLENKAAFLSVILSGRTDVREMEDIGSIIPTAEEFKAMATGNPLIKEKIGVEGRLGRLEAERSGHLRQETAVQQEMRGLPWRIAETKSRIAAAQRDVDLIESHKDDPAQYTIGKQGFEGKDARKRAGAALATVIESWRGMGTDDAHQKIGAYRGLKIWIRPGYSNFGWKEEGGKAVKTDEKPFPLMYLQGPSGATHDVSVNREGEISSTQQSIEATARGIGPNTWDVESLPEQEKKLADLQARASRPWPKQKEYEALRARKAEIDAELGESAAERASFSDEADDRSGERGGALLSFMSLGLDKFYVNDVEPTLIKAAQGIKEAVDTALKVLAPQLRSADAHRAGLGLRQGAADLARKTDQMMAAFATAKRAMDKLPQAEKYEFIKRMEAGQAQTQPALDTLALALRNLLDDRRDQVQNLGTGKLQAFYEDYFPHIWENPNQAKGVFSALFGGRRPIEGKKAFLKKRTMVTFEDGLNAGLKPVTDNPVELVLLKTREIDRYVMAHQLLAEWKATRLAKFVRPGHKAPAGWTKVADPIGIVWGRNAAGEMILRGNYYAPEGAATILENYLSPGLRQYGVFRALLGANNVLNQAQLGMSAYHLGFTSLDASVSKGALAIEQALHGKLGAALKSAAGVPLAPVTNWLQGRRMLQEWNRSGSQSPEIEKLVAGLVMGGGRAHMDEIYATNMRENMMKAFRSGNVLGGLLRAPFATLEATSNIIMKEIVPRQKLGVFADLARAEFERLGPAATDEQVRDAMGKAWDSVENRMGQLTYDNLFWNRTAKDLAMLSVRSVGWNLGTIREIGGAAIDAVKIPVQLATGNKTASEVNIHRLAYVASLAITSAVTGAIYQYLATGKGPQELKDYFFPRTGQLNESGRPQRVAMPTYVKDVYHYATEPGRTLADKVSPLASLFAEMVKNKDFYGNAIRNVDDPLIQQMLEAGKHVALAAEPFGIRTLEKETNLKAPIAQRIQQFVGITPAPSSIEKSSASLLASELAAGNIPPGNRTREQVERTKEERTIAELARTGRPVSAEIGKALRAGTVTMAEVRRALAGAHMDPLARTFKSLQLDQALKVWGKATPEERQKLRPLLLQKGKTLNTKTRQEQRILGPAFGAALSQR
jgi:N12 class adenine-specific DNA methylase